MMIMDRNDYETAVLTSKWNAENEKRKTMMMKDGDELGMNG
jgi:hypothetical protein